MIIFFRSSFFYIKIIKDLHNVTKNDLVSSVKSSIIVHQPIGFEKQKVWPVLKLFSKEVSDAIRFRHKNNKNALNKAKFLDFIITVLVEPLLTTDLSKGRIHPNCSPFSNDDDEILLNMLKLADWIQNKWQVIALNNDHNRNKNLPPIEEPDPFLFYDIDANKMRHFTAFFKQQHSVV